MFSNNLIISAKFLCSGIKQETSDADSPKIGNASETSLTTTLNNFYKPLFIFHVDNDAFFPILLVWV